MQPIKNLKCQQKYLLTKLIPIFFLLAKLIMMYSDILAWEKIAQLVLEACFLSLKNGLDNLKS